MSIFKSSHLTKHHSHSQHHHHGYHHSEGSSTELPRLIHNSLSCNELFSKHNYQFNSVSRLHFHLSGLVEIDFGKLMFHLITKL